MRFELRQIILLLIALAVPVFLLLRKRERLLLGWVGVTMFVQVFDTALVTNLPTGRIVGLLFLPQAILQLREWWDLKPVRAWLTNFGYLLVLGVLFGLLWQWPDITLMRPFTLTAPGRLIVYSTRLLSDFSLAIFVARQLRQPGTLLYLARALMLGATLTALAGLVYFIFKLDAYALITGLGEQILAVDRARGLSLEPRTLGLACAYGIMLLLLGRQQLSTLWPLLVVVNLLGLLVTYSASSLALLVAGVVTCSLFFSNRERALVVGVLLLSLVVITWAYLYEPVQFKYALNTLQLRLDPELKLTGIPPGNFGQEIAYRLDVFDACALLFLLDQPLYALTGTGPGLVCLPASYYVPPGLYSYIWTAETGINSLPFHGLLLEVSNGGLLGLICWIIQIWLCWKALHYLAAKAANNTQRTEWKFAYALFLIGVIFYVVQVSPSPVWSLFLALGWVAIKAANEELERVREEARQRAFEFSASAPDWAYSQSRRMI